MSSDTASRKRSMSDDRGQSSWQPASDIAEERSTKRAKNNAQDQNSVTELASAADEQISQQRSTNAEGEGSSRQRPIIIREEESSGERQRSGEKENLSREELDKIEEKQCSRNRPIKAEEQQSPDERRTNTEERKSPTETSPRTEMPPKLVQSAMLHDERDRARVMRRKERSAEVHWLVGPGGAEDVAETTASEHRDSKSDLMARSTGSLRLVEGMKREPLEEVSELKEELLVVRKQMETMSATHRNWQNDMMADLTGTGGKLEEMNKEYVKGFSGLLAELRVAREQIETMEGDHHEKMNALVRNAIAYTRSQVGVIKKENSAEIWNLMKDLDSKKTQIKTMETDHCVKENEYLQEQRNLKKALDEANETIAAMRAEYWKREDEIQAKVDGVKSRISTKEEKEIELRGELRVTKDQIQSLEERGVGMIAALEMANEKTAMMERGYREMGNRLQEELDEARMRIVTLEADMFVARSKIDQLETQRSKRESWLREAMKEVDSQISTKEERETGLRAALYEANDRIRTLELQYGEMEENLRLQHMNEAMTHINLVNSQLYEANCQIERMKEEQRKTIMNEATRQMRL